MERKVEAAAQVGAIAARMQEGKRVEAGAAKRNHRSHRSFKECSRFQDQICMKTWAIVLSSLLLTSAGLWGRPVDLSPAIQQFELVTSEGHLLVWREVVAVDFGNGLVLPLRMGFLSKEGVVSPHLGKNWVCPLLEARADLIREDMMEVHLLCGNKLYLDRNPKDPSRFRSRDYQWNGELKEEVFRIFRDDGWQLIFKDGEVEELRTDQGRVLKWVREGKRVSAILEKGSDPVFQVVFDPVHGLAKDIRVNSRVFVLDVSRFPGEPGVLQSLSAVTWPEGQQELYLYAMPRHQVGELLLKDRHGLEIRYSYDLRTGHILSEGGWEYEVSKTTDSHERPRISRVNQAGEKESYHFDIGEGVAELQTADGALIRHHLVTDPGPAYMHLKKTEQIVGGDVQTFYRATFDENGRLSRETDGAGVTWVLRYDGQAKLVGRTAEPVRDPEIIAQLARKEKMLLSLVDGAATVGEKDEVLRDLGFFYILEAREIAKAEGLVPRISNPRFRFNVLLFAVNADPARTLSSKIAEYRKLMTEFPDQKTFLENHIRVREKASKYEHDSL